jgi:hypothetical protein
VQGQQFVHLSAAGGLILLLSGSPFFAVPAAQAQVRAGTPAAGRPAPVVGLHTRTHDDDDGCSVLVVQCFSVPPNCPPTVVKVKPVQVVKIVKVFVPVQVVKVVKVFVPVAVAPTATATPPTTTIIVVVPARPAPTATPTPDTITWPGNPMF